MNFDMFSGKQNDDMDPNYIYPMPYIDPTMYANPYGMNGVPYPGYQMDPSMAMGGYMTYMNPYMNNPVMGQQQQNQLQEDDFDFEDMEDNMYMQDQMQGMPEMPPGMMMPGMMPGMPPGMMMPGMMPNMPPGMMMPGMMPNMPPGMMMPGMMPGMPPGMMFPYMMMPGMPQIHLEEFDEEEM